MVVDGDHEVLGQARLATPTSGGPPAVTTQMAEAMREAATAAGVETSALSGIGVGSPGAIDSVAGTVAHAGNLPDWDAPFAVSSTLTAALGAPVALANDVDAATLAEYELGAGAPYHDLLGVFWGTGVGWGSS